MCDNDVQGRVVISLKYCELEIHPLIKEDGGTCRRIVQT